MTGHRTPTKLFLSEKKTRRKFDTEFDPVAIEIGHVARLWNALHESLGSIFSQILKPADPHIALSVWHSQQSDRSQREMLRAAHRAWQQINTIDDEDKLREDEDRISQEISWILSECEKLSNKRNDALHTPTHVSAKMRRGSSSYEFTVVTNCYNGNPRALRLKGKDVCDEFSWYGAIAEKLYCHAVGIFIYLCDGGTFPQRPRLPTAGQYRTHRTKRRRTPSK